MEINFIDFNDVNEIRRKLAREAGLSLVPFGLDEHPNWPQLFPWYGITEEYDVAPYLNWEIQNGD